MKRYLTLLSAAIIFIFIAGSAWATPIYTGATYASWGEGGLPTLPTATGYYIWSNDPSKTSWSVRWTGNNNGDTNDWETWKGWIDFVGNSEESLTAIAWDTHDGPEPEYIHYTGPYSDYELISFSAKAGWHWDGFDFTVSAADLGRLRFNLGGSYYSALAIDNSDAGVSSYAMWIGDGNSMNVNVNKTTHLDENFTYQSFETPAPVPEPGTIVLLGLGMLGLCGLGYRRKK